MDDLLRRLEQHASHLEGLVDDKTRELEQEKKRSEDLLYQVLPRLVSLICFVFLRVGREISRSSSIPLCGLIIIALQLYILWSIMQQNGSAWLYTGHCIAFCCVIF